MKLYHLSSGPLKVNTYFLVNESTTEAAVIDCGENYNLIKKNVSPLLEISSLSFLLKAIKKKGFKN